MNLKPTFNIVAALLELLRSNPVRYVFYLQIVTKMLPNYCNIVTDVKFYKDVISNEFALLLDRCIEAGTQEFAGVGK